MCTGCGPFSVFILGDINSIVYQAHSVICSLMFKGVAIPFSIIHNKLNNLRSCVRNLNRIGLNMGNSKAPFLYLVFEVNHEQSSSFGYNIIFVSRITEWIIEICRSKTVNRIDCSLQSVRQILCRHFSINYFLNIRCQLSIQHMVDLIPCLMFNADSSFYNITE